ncbi:MAG: 30S ribosomal protein S12 methylthiotransferase RimO [Chloroflexota bacterium]|nr:30S ribosomal protein S12 methylthiotransferase RimO [Chloroflexota bacterium]
MGNAQRTFFIENLGCPKNAVEGEGMAEQLARAGYAAVDGAADADVVIVNTCSFIRPAQEESIDRLFHYLGRRRAGQKVVAAGCLAERYGEALSQDMPELDGILGTRRWFEIDRLVGEIERGARPCWHGADPAADPTFRRQADGPTAYVKIAEGCNMSCTFCAIPGFKGAQRSKLPAEIIREIRELVDGGVREVILVSQNTTAYGQDLVGATPAPSERGTTLARLLEQICDGVPDLPWLRFHYCYPGWVNDQLLQTMARLSQVVKYLDIPLQHAHPDVLRAMNRPRDVEHVKAVLARARELMPELALRTTFIVGFPGETAAHFAAVLRFMEAVQFDHAGVFPYFAEEGTPAASLPGQVSDGVKQRRKKRALEVQQGVSLARNQTFVGQELEVLVEGKAGETPATVSLAPGGLAPGSAGLGVPERLIGRTFRDAPEVDGFVVFRGRAERGDFVRVRVDGAGPYDLFGDQVGLVPEVPEVPRGVTGPKQRFGLKSLPVLQPR